MNKISFTKALLAALSCSGPRQDDLTSLVDPFIGTMLTGMYSRVATTPFGMVQISPDNGTRRWDWCSGYNYSDTVIAGSQPHPSKRYRHRRPAADILFLPSM